MSSPSHQTKASVMDIEDESLLSEGSQEEDVDLGAADSQMLKDFSSFGLVGGMFFTKKRLEIKDAFNTLKNINSAELLNFKDPTYYTNVRFAHTKTHKLIKERGKYHMDPMEVKRRTHALVIARRLHREVNQKEKDIRLNNTLTVYGLQTTPDMAEQFRTSINKWLQENPGKTLEDAITVVGRNFYLEQNKLKEEELAKEQKEELGKKQEELVEKNKSARDEAITATKDKTDRAVETIGQIMDPESLPPTTKRLSEQLEYINTGQIVPTTTTPTPIFSQTTTPIDSVTTTLPTSTTTSYFDSTTTTTTTTPFFEQSTSTMSSSIPVPTPKITTPTPTVRPPTFISSGFSNLSQRYASFLNSINLAQKQMSKIASRAMANVATKVLTTAAKVGMKVAGKLGLKALEQALATALPGIGNAVMAAIQALGLDEVFLKFALKAAIFVVAIPVAILILLVFVLNDTSHTVPNYSNQNAMSVALRKNTSNLSFREFEKKYLSKKRDDLQKITWLQFEKEYLTLPRNYLSSGY